MSRLRTLLLSSPALPDAAAVWFGDLPMDAPIECCYGPPSHASAMGLWFPKLGADAKLEIIVGPAPAGPCMGIWRGTVLDWPGNVFMVGAPPKSGFPGCWVRPGQAPGRAGGCLWSARGRAPRHLVPRPPRPPWRLALTPVSSLSGNCRRGSAAKTQGEQSEGSAEG